LNTMLKNEKTVNLYDSQEYERRGSMKRAVPDVRETACSRDAIDLTIRGVEFEQTH
jgi:hypothetical protein